MRARWMLAAGVVALAAGGAAPSQAQAADACAGRYAGHTPVDLAGVAAGGAAGISKLWGRDRMSAEGGVLSVSFPKDSINPGNRKAPEGGAGFLMRVSPGGNAACVGYGVRFQSGFAFAKGGKLPGLFGGEAPSGCAKNGSAPGFSARLMWRAKGAGEVYLYAPGRTERCGESIKRGAFTFSPGRWTRVVEEVVLNDPGEENGRLRLWIDGRLAIDRADMRFRDSPSTLVDGVMFSTFFGGDDPSYASPADQTIEFRDMVLHHGG